MNRRELLKGLLGSTAALAGVRWTVAAHAQSAKVLRIGMDEEVLTLDPIKTVYGGDIITQGIMFARLLRANADRSQVFPGLAERWEISDDGLTYVFHLRDAKFSDGSPLTAEDVAFSYNRMRHQKDSAYAAPFQALQTAEAKDPKTVVMHLDRRFTPFLTLTEIWNTGIVPKAVVEKLGDEAFARKPIVSGPFALVEWRQGDRVILEKNPHYYREGLPHLDGVEIIFVPDDTTRLSMFQAGEIDVLMAAPAPRFKDLSAHGFRAEPEPSTLVFDILINHAKEPFNDLKVRQAVSLALDRKAISDAVTTGLGQPGTAVMSPALNFFNKDLPVVQRDVARAKSLLAEAGKQNIGFELMIAAGSVSDEREAVVIQSQLAEAGIAVTISKADASQEWDRLINGEYQANLNWWYNETRDPDNALRWIVWGAGDNKSYYTRYNNDRVNQLIDQAAGEVDEERRRQLYYEVQKIAYDEVAQIVLFYPPFLDAYSPKVKNLNLNPGLQFSSIDETTLG